VTIRGEDDLSPDPDDNVFCACAEQGRAAFIATLTQEAFPPKEPDRQGDFAW
jgi:predicted nucleic acid-binding protein